MADTVAVRSRGGIRILQVFVSEAQGFAQLRLDGFSALQGNTSRLF